MKKHFINSTSKKLSIVDEMRSQLRREGYACSTVNSYRDWVKRFMKLHAFESRESLHA